MLVENKRLRIICLTDKHEGGLLRSLDLRPGINKVDPTEWEKVAACRATYSKNDFEVVNPKGDDLKGIPEETAAAMVSKTGDRQLLKDWRDAGPKGDLRDAIENQLAELTQRITA